MPLPRTRRMLLLAGCLLAALGGATIAADRSASAMGRAATAFLDSLTPAQRQQATFPFDGDERFHWNFIPTEAFPRNGLTLKEMTEAQRQKAHDLLKAGLSQRGYMTATAIIDLETVLGDIEQRQRQARGGRGNALRRDPERYFFSVFGTPSSSAPWGWRVEGHHVSLHFTVVDGRLVASTPAFFGANPAEVRDGPKKRLRILGDQEDIARSLVTALDARQRTVAIIDGVAPRDILTHNAVEIDPLSPVGVTAADLTAAQRETLTKLIETYTSRMADDIASERMAAIRSAGIEKVAFAWAGGTARGEQHYYRVQGPTFLIEHDNTQNDGNHVHSVWRDFNGDFGRDLLREHLQNSPH